MTFPYHTLNTITSHLFPINSPLSLYFHVPFCTCKCDYCSFYSQEVGSIIGSVAFKEKVTTWKDSIINEIKKILPSLLPSSIYTIYFGGGTPSLVPPVYFEEIFYELQKCCCENAIYYDPEEISIEVNPSFVTQQLLDEFLSIGFNRITFGIQSFNKRFLDWMGRNGDSYIDKNHIKSLLSPLVKRDINFGIDLICGFPTQTSKELLSDCESAILLNPKHISLYRLVLDSNTPLTKRFHKFTNKELSTGDSNEIKAMNFLESRGYLHYEISNYAIAPYLSKHNCVYWNMDNSLAFGPSGVSTLLRDNGREGALRIINKEDMKFEIELISQDEFRFENMMMGLRMREGVLLKKFKERFLHEPSYFYKEAIEKAVKEKMVIIDDVAIKMTQKGFHFLNSFLLELMK